jgi:plastocyanin
MRKAFLAPLLIALFAVACGDDDTTATTPEATTTVVPNTTVASGDAVSFVLIGGQPPEGFEDLPLNQTKGFGVDGADIVAPAPTLSVHVGDEVTITLENRQPFEEQHNFVIVADVDDGYADALWDARILGLDVGESGEVTFTPDTAGSYLYLCTVKSHRFQGMAGAFVVEG